MDSNQLCVNIFVHCASGTGTSELARTPAAALGCELFEVASEDDDGNGNPVTGERCLRAYRVNQSFVDGRRTSLLFDEVEDALGDSGNAFGFALHRVAP